MKSIDRLFANNRSWAKRCLRQHPRYFKKLASIQRPRYLWIGCSDARVPANTIIGLDPGEIFVHRNVANQVPPKDLNCLSVIQFAVEFLKVRDILICGHYGCGGVRGALEDKKLGLIDRWLEPIKKTSRAHARELNALPDFEARMKRLCELNIHRQVVNLCRTDTVQRAWKTGQPLSIHGMVYDLRDGLLNKLDLRISSNKDLKRIS